jgi:hypothetical protein
MIECERMLLKRIDAQEKEIAALLLKLHRMPLAAGARMGARPSAARGGRHARA